MDWFAIERFCDKLIKDNPDIQAGEILSLIYVYLTIHHPETIEVYEDGQIPIFLYTHPDYVNRLDKPRKK